jgi:hypothetical protein
VTVAFCVVNLVRTGTWQILGPALTKQLSGEASWGFVLSARSVGLLVMGAIGDTVPSASCAATAGR